MRIGNGKMTWQNYKWVAFIPVIFISVAALSKGRFDHHFDNIGCAKSFMYDAESLHASGNGELLDALFVAARSQDIEAIEALLESISKRKKSDMDAAIIWILAGESGLVKDEGVYRSTSVSEFAAQWKSRDEHPHLHAARIYSRAKLGFNPYPPKAYPWLHFLKRVARPDMKPIIGEYLEMVSHNVEPLFAEGMLTAANHMAACNGIE